MVEYLRSPTLAAAPVVETDGRAIVLDLGSGSMALGEPLSGLSVERLGQLIDRAMAGAGTGFAYGRWGEARELYTSDLFATDGRAETRTVHLGVDVFCAAGTTVRAPLDGEVLIKANNAADLDYGPMLVVGHATPDGAPFNTLYGHLALDSIAGLEEGQHVAAGEPLAAVGTPPENGNWPPHLHLQLILDLLGLGAAFPGVAFPSEQDVWLGLSPLPDMLFPDCHPLDGRTRDR